MAGAVTAGALALTGCVNNSKSSGPSAPSSSGTVGAISKDSAAAALLPASVKSAGKLVVGINLPYEPNEYRDTRTNKIVGWEVDFLDGVAKELGITTQYQESGFDTIIPSVKGAKFDIGMSSLTDNKEREQQVDFVNYYTAGMQWAAPAGKTVKPDDACGLKVAVETGTTEQTDDLPGKSKDCVAAGKKPITILKIDSQGAVNQAVILGQADAFDADSPITEYAVKQSQGKLQLAGDIYGGAPYGLVVAKTNTGLQQALQKAIQDMMDNGTYTQILTKWGVQAGAITKATINGASS
ncbi:MAG TPA: ABC transporter substrate-binding protein [Jatrophihabitans sp.]|nr:ABC transporter substrate-binding protein [Jatrophihabitans sp.]